MKMTLREIVEETGVWAVRIALIGGFLYLGPQVLHGCATYAKNQMDKIDKYYAPKALESLGDVNGDGYKDFKVITEDKDYTFYGTADGKYVYLEEERK